MCGAAMAEVRPSEAMIAVRDWMFTPIVDDASGSAQVRGFLALRDKSTSTGDNLVAVWYQRPASPAGEWEAKTWEVADHWEAIKTLKDQYGISDVHDAVWPTDDEQTGGPAVSPPKEYASGFVADDEIGIAVSASPERGYLIEVLASIGYKVGDVEFDKELIGACGQKAWLDTMATSVEVNHAAPDTMLAPGSTIIMDFIAGCTLAQANPPTPRTCPRTVSYGAWPATWTCPASPGAWQGPTGDANGPCKYSRSMTCTQTRTVSITNTNCTVSTSTQTRNQIQRQDATCARLPNGGCPPPATCIGAILFTPNETIEGPAFPVIR